MVREEARDETLGATYILSDVPTAPEMGIQGPRDRDRDALQPELDVAGADGWELVSATAMFNTWMSKVVYVLFLKRPAS